MRLAAFVRWPVRHSMSRKPAAVLPNPAYDTPSINLPTCSTCAVSMTASWTPAPARSKSAATRNHTGQFETAGKSFPAIQFAQKICVSKRKWRINCANLHFSETNP